MQSPKGTLSKEDIIKWGKNTLVFLAPVILLYITSIQTGIQTDGLSASDFAITPMVAGAITLYLLNVATDLLKKLSAGSSV